MFNQPTIVELNAKVGSEIKIPFTFDENIKLITRVETSCGCTLPIINMTDRRIVARVIPNPIPPHLIKVGKYTKRLTVTVSYDSIDGTNQTETLSIILQISK